MMSMCLQGIVDEIIREKEGKPIRMVNILFPDLLHPMSYFPYGLMLLISNVSCMTLSFHFKFGYVLSFDYFISFCFKMDFS